MKFLHAAIAVSSRGNAEWFFEGILGLAVARTYGAPRDLMMRLFGLDADADVVAYACGDAQIEVFAIPSPARPRPPAHVCIAVPDAAGLLDRCRAAGLEVRSAPRGDSFVSFVSDRDGNMYEIKQIQKG